MLRGARRILKSHGRMVFFNIEVVPGLDRPAYEQAVSGDNADLHQELSTTDRLDLCGFTCLEERDVTGDYLHTVRRWLDAVDDLEAPLRASLGDEVYEERVGVRREGMELTEAGLHRRMLYVAE